MENERTARQEVLYKRRSRRMKAALKALDDIYPNFERTGCEDGEDTLYYDDENDYVEYQIEVIFDVGNILGDTIVAGGWVTLRSYGNEINIDGIFSLSRNGNWEDKRDRIFTDDDYRALLGWYNKDKSWTLEIGTY